MGPLVPDIIGSGLNFVIALFIGIAFGYILEQAGFSTSKKLVGLFYGYDFTVLRVFFTAGVVAMLGVIALDHFGLLDMNIVYVNPTFIGSAIVGGLIMGLGFVIGGFCPGTSVCASAIGKIDGMFFVLGTAIGVFIFAEAYPLYEEFYKSGSWGYVRIFDTLGMSQTFFAFLLTVFAVVAFWLTTKLETRINGKPNPEFSSKKLYSALFAIGIIAAFSAFMFPQREALLMEKINDLGYVRSLNVEYMDSDELSIRLMNNDPNIIIADFRNEKEYKKLPLPQSENIKIKSLFDKYTTKLFSLKHRINVFVANDELLERKAAALALALGYENIVILKGGFNRFKTEILNFKMPDKKFTDRHNRDTFRFRAEASKVLPKLIKEFKLSKSNAPKKKKTKRVIGGC